MPRRIIACVLLSVSVLANGLMAQANAVPGQLSPTLLNAAVAPAADGATQIDSLLRQLEELQSKGTKLESEVGGLEGQLSANLHGSMESEIRDREDYLARVRRERPDAIRFLTPELAQTEDWKIAHLEHELDRLRRELSEQVRLTKVESQVLLSRVAAKRDDLTLNLRLQKALENTIRNLREDRRNEAAEAELDAVKGSIRGSITTTTHASMPTSELIGTSGLIEVPPARSKLGIVVEGLATGNEPIKSGPARGALGSIGGVRIEEPTVAPEPNPSANTVPANEHQESKGK